MERVIGIGNKLWLTALTGAALALGGCQREAPPPGPEERTEIFARDDGLPMFTPEPISAYEQQNFVLEGDTGFLRQPQVLSFVPISKSTLWRRVHARTFPEPVKLSERVTVWRAEDIRRWIEQQGVAS